MRVRDRTHRKEFRNLMNLIPKEGKKWYGSILHQTLISFLKFTYFQRFRSGTRQKEERVRERGFEKCGKDMKGKGVWESRKREGRRQGISPCALRLAFWIC
jgi:hypothetical protein